MGLQELEDWGPLVDLKARQEANMTLLLTSDLHLHSAKLLHLLNEAPAYDAMLVAGDHLNIFAKSGLDQQADEVLRWRNQIIAAGKSFAWCSGNHDYFYDRDTLMEGAAPQWMRQQSSTKTCITDGESRLLHVESRKVVITTIPWPVSGGTVFVDGVRKNYHDVVQELLRCGEDLRNKEKVPWFLLNHEPPADSPLCGGYEAAEANYSRRLIESFQPDFSVHGHIHQAPTAVGGSWISRIGKTISFNAGQSALGQPPHFVLLCLGQAGKWHASWHFKSGTEEAHPAGDGLHVTSDDI